MQSRLSGGGRKKRTEHNPNIPEALESLIDPVMRGDPESPLRWTCKSIRRLASELQPLVPCLFLKLGQRSRFTAIFLMSNEFYAPIF